MSNGDDTSQQPEDFSTIGNQLLLSLMSGLPLDAVQAAWVGAHAAGHQANVKPRLENLASIMIKIGETFVTLEEPVLAVIAPFVETMIANMLSGTVDPS